VRLTDGATRTGRAQAAVCLNAETGIGIVYPMTQNHDEHLLKRTISTDFNP